MEAAKKNDLVFNSTKCIIKTKSKKFFGGVYDENGVHRDPPQIEDIKSLKSPANVTRAVNGDIHGSLRASFV